jgi:hypothetical protein
VTFDKTSMTYQNHGKAVRDLPADHDPTDLMAAMAQAMDTSKPALGVLYNQPRPTLGDAMNDTILAAGGKPFVEAAQVA